MAKESTFWRGSVVFLFQLLFLLVPFIWTSTTSELFEFPKMLAVYVFTWLILSVWAIRMVQEKRFILKRTPLDLPLLLFVASQVIATVFSMDVHTSLIGYYSRFNGGLYSTLAYTALFYALVSNISKEDVKRIIGSLLIGAVGASLYAFPEHFGASPSCFAITGNWDVACWVQDVQTRVFGTFGQPNWLAAYLISIIFIPIAFILERSKELQKRQYWQWFAELGWPIFVATVFFMVTLFTKSRSGVLGLGVGMTVFWGLLFWRTFRTDGIKTHLRAFLVQAIALLLIFFAFGKGIVPGIDNKVEKLAQPFFSRQAAESPVLPEGNEATPRPQVGTQLETGGTQSSKIREIVWRGALKLWQKYPLFGSGTETFAYGYYNVRPAEHNLVSEWDFLYNKAHNEFLNYLSTTGLFGLGTYLWFMAAFSLIVIRQVLNADKSEDESMLPFAFLAGFWALAISNFFGFSTVMVQLVFFLFPAFSMVYFKKQEVVSEETPQWFLWTIAFLVIGLGIYSTIKIGTSYAADVKYAQGTAFSESNQLQEALTYLSQASMMVQNEPNYTDQLSLAAAKSATALLAGEQATAAAQMAQQAHALSNETIRMNDVHLNFYKNRIRVFIQLSQINPQYAQEALRTFQVALALSPTDAKLWFNLGLLHAQLDNSASALQALEKAVILKPDYEAARMELGNLYAAQGKSTEAREQYWYILENLNPNNERAQESLEQL